MAWYVYKAEAQMLWSLPMREPQVNRDSTLLFFLEAIRVDAG